ncbi:MAG: energy transducer TonB [Pantoea sp. Pent]|nr:energy transducer TonB [Pantoea sp. Pent]
MNMTDMTTLTTPFPTRTPVSVILSVLLHGSVIAGILYASFHQTIEVPKASQPISISMVAPEVQPKPEPKPKPKVEKKAEPKPRQQVKPQENPFKQDAPAAQTRPSTAPKSNLAPTQTVSDGPKAMSVSKPAYPARAFALRVEGRVRVKFDVDSDGRVDNVEILSAEPRNMFEREVKQAMKKWLYQPGRPGKGLTMNIVFRINGGANIE